MRLKRKTKKYLRVVLACTMVIVMILPILANLIPQKQPVVTVIPDESQTILTEQNKPEERPVPQLTKETYQVLEIVNPNTISIHMDGKSKNVQFMGIEVNERQGAKTVQEMLKNQSIQLEYEDITMPQEEDFMAYIFLEDGTFVNEQLLISGVAKVVNRPDQIKYLDVFNQAQESAKEQQLGIWAKEAQEK